MVYDLAINNGIIVDGSSRSRFKGSIGINKSKISKISSSPLEARKTIDASNLIVSPGFIDIHTHSETGFLLDNRMENKIFQGVTSDIVGNCGISIFPRPKDPKLEDSFKSYCSGLLIGMDEISKEFKNTREYTDFLQENKIGINCGVLIGHGSLRIAAMGFKDQAPSSSELDQMKEDLDKELSMGALGMSLGLIYPPGSYSKDLELIELAKVLKKHDAILTAHIRNEGDRVFESVEEIIKISKSTGVRAHISHLKLLGPSQWGKAKALVDMIEGAQEKGIKISTDQYPYLATSTSLTALVPQWAQEGGSGKMLERFTDRTIEDQLGKEIRELMEARGGADKVMIAYTHGRKPEYEGKLLSEISEGLKLSFEKTLIRILKESKAKVNAVYYSICKEDMRYILGKKEIAIASDGFAFSFDRKDSGGLPHPRSFGSFPRFLRLARDEKILTLELAIRKITSLPARIMGLENIGEIKINNYADISIFSEDDFSDRASFKDPFQKPVGLEYVIISGRLAVEKGRLTDQRLGRILKLKGEKKI